ncbi:AraC family transcriptional regulator [Thalassoglobus sp. JC818]|uniref:AraC family transcriptional regulator n=1 Tax=Thalassoglobus sp. JC818 TaxID=3232136 RepID=UPI003459AF30
MQKLIDLAKPLITCDGFIDTRINRARLFRTTTPILRQPILYESWIVANLQGRKTLYYSDRTIQYDDNSILCVTSGSPVECAVDASQENPLIAVVIDVRFEELMSLSARMMTTKGAKHTPPRTVDIFPFTHDLKEVYGRLLAALHSPSDAAILGESLVLEVMYRVLQNGLADSLSSIASNRNSASILQALRIINESYTEELIVEHLAERVAMSVSAFHQHFRKITSDSPLQYIKGVRLTKARQMIQSGSITVSEVARKVGYESPSQFSREYKRYFGLSPTEDRT